MAYQMLSDHVLGRHCQALKIEAWSLNKKARRCTLLQLALLFHHFSVRHSLADVIQCIVDRHEWCSVSRVKSCYQDGCACDLQVVAIATLVLNFIL